MRKNKLVICILSALSISSASCFAEELDDDIGDISLEDLMNIEVTSVSKNAQKMSEAPAVVAVVTRADIDLWGYRSVAEALKQVPGLYGVDDHVSTNYGVRGSNGGLRAYSRNLKVMINGQSIAFRSDSANYLGQELISMDVVERIEIVRGPASALYGENAFLGIVNILTRSGENGLEGKINLKVDNNGSNTLNAWLAYSNDKTKVNFSLANAKNDRDGHLLPTTSPSYDNFAGNTESQNDESKPSNIYLDINHQINDEVKFSMMYHKSNLDSIAEFIDFGILTHENRIVLESDTLRVKTDWTVNSKLSVNASLTKASGSSGNDERLSFGSSAAYPSRDFSYDATDWAIEGRYEFGEKESLTFGYDTTNNDEELLEIYNIDIATGNATLVSAEQGIQNFENKGMYIQYATYPTEKIGLTVNLRSDDHNIYGSTTNYRAGLVYIVSSDISVKALYGTSYKAPAAFQLFSQPLYAGEVIGNPDLAAEEATTLEFELNWKINDHMGVTINAYDNEIENRVELVPVGSNNQPQNRGTQTGKGIESELRYVVGSDIISANFAYADSENNLNDPILGTLTSAAAMYPKLTSQLRWQHMYDNDSNLGVAVRYTSERRATRSNIQLNSDTPYQLDGYFIVDASYSKKWGVHELMLQAYNLLDESYEEPGFSGIDVPGRQQEIVISYSYNF